MQSRMDNPETLATLDTQDTGRRQSQHKTQDDDNHNTRHRTKTITIQDTGRRQSQHNTENSKQLATWIPPKPGINPGAHNR